MNTPPTSVESIVLGDIFDAINAQRLCGEQIEEIRRKVSDDIKTLLDRQKMGRSDVGNYTLDLKMRQDIINERVVKWSIGDEITRNSIVLDACAGPGGSFHAVTQRGGQWIGNEIAQKTVDYLQLIGANAHLGSAENLEFDDEQFDAVLFVFAMNNIQATGQVMREACRVLKQNGSIVICDPGPTSWMANLALYGAWTLGLVPQSMQHLVKCNGSLMRNIIDFYERFCKVTPEQYAAKILEGLFDLDLEATGTMLSRVGQYMNQTYPCDCSPKRLERIWSEILNAEYWGVIMNHAQTCGLTIEKFGIISSFVEAGQSDWSIIRMHDLPVPTSSRELSEMLYNIRNGRHELSPVFTRPEGKKTQKNILSPALHLRKARQP